MHRDRNAKIVATLGPASSSPEIIRALFEAGADVFRLNFSHGGHADHQARYEAIREVERDAGRPIGVLADLQGPKLRIGTFAGGPVTLEPGRPFRLDLDPTPGDNTRVHLPHPEIFAALHPGAELLLDDGKIRLAVERCGDDFADTQVAIGGRLSERKGVNVPGVVLPLSALTEKDRRDLDFALSLGVDWIALSFVQRPEDLDEVRGLAGGRVRLVAKLEKPAAVERLDAIVERADALMIARGDLGVELPPQRVPTVQRRALRACRAAGKPAIVATQMLESMIEAPTPTRAEASDVATAVYDGADAVMLSAESAAGRYPVEAVRIMDGIIAEVERDPYYRKGVDAAHPDPTGTIADAICCAMRRATGILPVVATVAYTCSGSTALRAARERPAAPILGLTPSIATARRLMLVWGVHPVCMHEVESVDEMVSCAADVAIAEGFGRPGDIVAIAAGMPFRTPGTTNLLRIARLSGVPPAEAWEGRA
jgi:pyruvate kinase